MTDEIENEETLESSSDLESKRLEKVTLLAKLSVEKDFGGLHVFDGVSEVVEAYFPCGIEDNVIITTEGKDISSVANAILTIGTMKGVKIEKLLESNLNNERLVKQLVIREIKSNGGSF